MSTTTAPATPFLAIPHLLGELPIYDARTHHIYWCAAHQAELHRMELLPDSAAIAEYLPEQLATVQASHQVVAIGGEGNPSGEAIGTVALTKTPHVLLVTSLQGLGFVDFASGKYYPQEGVVLNDDPAQRTNDGIIDLNGDLLVGTMEQRIQYPANNVAVLRRLNTDLLVEVLETGLGMSNQINVLPAGQGRQTVFFTDTMSFCVWKYDYDLETKELSNKRPFIDIRDTYAPQLLPALDGGCITEDGQVFHAVWGRLAVCHFDAEGKLVQTIEFPAQRVTACCWMGKDRNELFVTTALNKWVVPDGVDHTKTDDLGGRCFRVRIPGVRGVMKDNYWGGPVPSTA